MKELREMNGQPVWVLELGRWALVQVNATGVYKGMPFVMYGQQGATFTLNVQKRKFHCCREKPNNISESAETEIRKFKGDKINFNTHFNAYRKIVSETKSKRVQLQMRPSLHEAIRLCADDTGVSVNEYIHNVLMQYFGRKEMQ